MRFRIVIPARNEEFRLRPTIVDYCEFFAASANVTIVANGCTDGTVRLVREFMSVYPNLSLVEVPFGIGKGGAVRVGLKLGDEPFVGFTDADGSTPAASYADLFQACEHLDADAAIGSRWLPSSRVDVAQPIFRRLASRVFNVGARLLFGFDFVDTQCGAKVFTRAAIDSTLRHLELSNFAFDVDILQALHRRDYDVREIPITWNDRAGTTVRVVPTALAMAIGLVRLRLRTGFWRRLPFVDRIARPSVIPYKTFFSALVLCDGRTRPADDARIDAWITAANAAGNSVRRVTLFRSVRKTLRTFAWYLARGNVAYDVIIDVDRALPTWFRLLSTKNVIGPEVLAEDDVAKIFGHLSAYFGYTSFFGRETGGGWYVEGGSPRSRVYLVPVSDASRSTP